MTEPLVPTEVDLREFQYMELDVRRLRDSGFASKTSGDGFRAGLLLWCASWHQQPAGSLPDDDGELATLCGYGRDVKSFKKVRADALYGWSKCKDGRWYHAVVAEKANAAWSSKLHHSFNRHCDRLRKENARREKEKIEKLPIPTFEQWDSERRSAGIPAESGRKPPAVPPDSVLRGNGTEPNGDSNSVPDGTGATAPADTADTIFSVGVTLLTASGVTERNARTFLGKARKDHGDDAVIAVLAKCAEQKPLQPIPWLIETLKLAGATVPKNGNGGGVQWWSSEATIVAKGKEVGINAKPGESMNDYKGRVSQAIEQQARAH